MDKKSWRKELLSRREQLNPALAAAHSELICAILLANPLLHAPRRVMLYLPIRGEVDLTPLMTAIEREGVKVLLPKVVAKGVIEAFYCPQPWQEQVEVGSYGILEPRPGTLPISPVEIDLVLVPGVAFDRDFYRLGYGGGYYDRLLARLSPRTLKIGVAYSLQVVESLPRDNFDCRLDAIVTEKGLLWHRPADYA